MKIVCCDGCNALIDDSYGEEKRAIDIGQVFRVEVKVISDDGLNECGDPTTNRKFMFCSAKCALDYLNKIKVIEDRWLKTWKDGKILGKKKIILLKDRR